MTVQAQILDLLRDMVRRMDMAAIVITHDLGVVAHYCDRMAVMYAGAIVEQGPVAEVFAQPAHPYTRSLIAATPERLDLGAGRNRRRAAAEPLRAAGWLPLPRPLRLWRPTSAIPRRRSFGSASAMPRAATSPPACRRPPPPRAMNAFTRSDTTLARPPDEADAPVLAVENLVKHFPTGDGQTVHAVNGVDFTIRPGEVLGMVGESGSGKSDHRPGRAAPPVPDLGHRPVPGARHLAAGRREDCRPLRGRHADGVSRTLGARLNPRMKGLGADRRDAQAAHRPRRRRPPPPGGGAGRAGAACRRRISTAIPPTFPAASCSGCASPGRSRTNPKLIVLDEPTSSLDLSVRAGILELLAELRAETKVAMLFISHDLGTVRLISDRIVVLYLGSIVEYAGRARSSNGRPIPTPRR